MDKSSLPLRLGDIRKQNERLILDMFFDKGRVSQSDAVSATGLKPSTILNIFTNLQEFGDIIPCDNQAEAPANLKRGRRPAYFQINPDAHYTMGISFDDKMMSLICVNFGLETIYKASVEMGKNIGLDAVIQDARRLVERAIKETTIEKDKLLGIGFCLPGTFDLRARKLLWYPYIHGLEDKDIIMRFQEAFEFPVFIESNTRASATYLARYGLCSHLRSFLLISLASTVEAAFYSSDSPETEQNAFMEMLNIGHIANGSGKRCDCGKIGCLNASLSSRSFVEDFGEFCDAGSLEEVANAVKSKVEGAIQLFDQKAKLFAEYISKFNTLLLPEKVIIMSEDQELSELLVEYCQQYFKPKDANCQLAFWAEPDVIPAENSLIDQARSGVDLVYDDFFGTPLLPWSRPWRLPGILKQKNNNQQPEPTE
jgi:predicted NBD/HSP70 family sugar kinase